MSSIFTAAKADDVSKFNAVIAPGFYIYDAGARFDGDSIMALIKTQHLAGKRYEWNVTEPDVHVSGKTAWVAYVNKGSVTDAAGTVNQNWLESAFLHRQACGKSSSCTAPASPWEIKKALTNDRSTESSLNGE